MRRSEFEEDVKNSSYNATGVTGWFEPDVRVGTLLLVESETVIVVGLVFASSCQPRFNLHVRTPSWPFPSYAPPLQSLMLAWVHTLESGTRCNIRLFQIGVGPRGYRDMVV